MAYTEVGVVPNVIRPVTTQGAVLAGAAFVANKMWRARQRRLGRPVDTLTRDEARSLLGDYAVEGKEATLSGYRRECGVCGCLCGCGSVNNETCNIWTHAIAALVFANAASKCSPTSPARLSAWAATLVFLCSTAAHTHMPLGEAASKILFRIDRASIAIYVLLSTVSVGLQHFLVSRGERGLALVFTAATGAAGACSAAALFVGSTAGVQFGILAVQACLNLVPTMRELALTPSAEAPFVSLICERNAPLRRSLPQVRAIVASHVVLSLSASALGGMLFSTGFPEAYCECLRLRPGTFDTVGSSHSLHVFVALGAWFAFRGQRRWEGAQLAAIARFKSSWHC